MILKPHCASWATLHQFKKLLAQVALRLPEVRQKCLPLVIGYYVIMLICLRSSRYGLLNPLTARPFCVNYHKRREFTQFAIFPNLQKLHEKCKHESC